MYKSVYKVTLKEPIIVSAKDKTETALNCLDYIPGNIFLGMTAGKLYDENTPTKTLDIFHNGLVSFGNAYPSINNKQLNPIPAVWYAHKGLKLDKGIELYHDLTDEHWENFAKEGIQIKQQRSGYFYRDGNKIKITTPKKGVVLKSEYNSDRKSAKEGQMYLYEYLEAGQEFIFEITSSEKEYLSCIEDNLTGDKYISKSKTAEFGAISIEILGEKEIKVDFEEIENAKIYTVYAQSNLSFINKFGEFTWTPTADDLGIENGKINYEKSQVWFDRLHTRNGKRKNYDADRLIIKKGSVFIIEGGKPNNELIKKGVGIFLSEGYGKILINPDFLNKEIKEYSFCYYDFKDNEAKYNENGKLNTILKNRFEKETRQKEMYNEVNVFIKTSKANKINPSQWGAMRALIYQARASEEDTNTELYKLIFDETVGYINHGLMAAKWKNIKNKLGIFLNVKLRTETGENEKISDENIEKLLLLTIEAAKKQ